LLLTNRTVHFHQRIGLVFEYHLDGGGRGPDLVSCWIDGMPPSHVWIGTTAEDQERADQRVPHLLNIPAAVNFLSCEPLLGPVDLNLGSIQRDKLRSTKSNRSAIDWIIAGGESGPQARPMHPDWARSLRDQAQTFGVPYLFKQWGEYDQDGRRVGKHAAGRCLDGRTHDGGKQQDCPCKF
jgi:protein gp37